MISWDLLPHQWEVLQSDAEVTSMSCAVGAGKTYMAATLAIYNLLEGRKVLLIGPTLSQLNNAIIRQMLYILEEKGIQYKHNKSLNKFDLGTNGELVAGSAENIESWKGVSKIDVLIIDECQLIANQDVYGYASSRIRDGKKGVKGKTYLFGNGCENTHWFAKESMKPECKWITVDAWQNERFNGKGYADRLCKLYMDMPKEFIDRELYGLFTSGSASSSIFSTVNMEAKFEDGPTLAGMDIAGTGDDYSAISIFRGNMLIWMEKKKTRIDTELKPWQAEMNTLFGVDHWNVDSTWGIPMEWQGEYTNCNFGSSGGFRFANLRTKMYFDLKEKLYKGICFAETWLKNMFMDECWLEMMCTKLRETENNKLILIDKGQIRKIIKRSPDMTDSLALASIPLFRDYTIDYAELRKKQIAANPFGYSKLK